MKILVAHNRYLYRGGEDTVVDAEVNLLRQRGHQVWVYSRDNTEIQYLTSIKAAKTTFWSRQTVQELQKINQQFSPDLIHAHNTFPLISPSLYWAAARARIPVVQTLHNFRLMCLNALFLRDEKVCEDCMGQVPWRGVARACYRGSRVASAALAAVT